MNANLIKISLAVFVFGIGLTQMTAAQTCATAPIGLISSYSGDGNALDARSRSNGTIQNDVTYVGGNVGQAFQLGGAGNASGSGDRVIVGNPANLRLQSFTVEAWVKRSSSTIVTNSPVAGFVGGTLFAFGNGGYGLAIDQPTNRLTITRINFSNVYSNFTITDTNWHHVAVSYNGSQAVFYVDGVADTPVNYGVTFTFSANAAIGARGDNDARNAFFGAIDELAIYNRVLSASEIAAIFNAGTVGKCKPLAIFAPENQVLWLAGDGDALDSSGNGNNGTLQSGANYTVGRVGQGFQFDGSGGTVSVPDNPSLSFGGNAPMTVEIWVYRTSNNAIQHFIGKRLGCTAGNIDYQLVRDVSGGFGLGFNRGSVSAFNNSEDVPLNTWTHLAGTYDGTTSRLYKNGVQIASAIGASGTANSAPLVIGNSGTCQPFGGSLDEPSVYNRALSAAEIESITNAGLAGKYKVQSTVPTGLAAWFAGDGNALDLQAGNNGTIQNSVTYAAGKVGQAFQLGGNGNNSNSGDRVIIGNPPSLQLQTFTVEAWVKRSSAAIVTNSPVPGFAGGTIFAYGASGWGFVIEQTTNRLIFSQVGINQINSNFTITDTNWHHVAVSISGAQAVFYLDGVADTPITYSSIFAYTTNAAIGARGDSDARNTFFGAVDELSIYNRVLTATEIRDQFYAGSGGKYKAATNPTVSDKTKIGEAEVTFGTITSAGAVHLTPINLASYPPLPMGMNVGLNFDISTSAVYTNPTVCLNVPSFTPAQFPNLRIYHLESGVWQNRTAVSNTYPNLCTSGLTSLSPFAVVSNVTTAANSSIGGRVIAGKGGLGNVNVTLSGGSLPQPISIKTNSFGNYRFDNLPTGETYILTVSAKKYTFTTPTKTVNLNDEVTDADFTAESQ